MGIFSTIMEKLGFGDDEKEQASGGGGGGAIEGNDEAAEESAAAEAPVVDVAAKLDALADENPEDLNWKVSIVDLLKLLGIDSSYAHRKELAAEVGIEGYEGTAEQNIQLHKTVLAKLAENGGNVPAELIS